MDIDYEKLRRDLRDDSMAAFFGGGIGSALLDAFDEVKGPRLAKLIDDNVDRFEKSLKGKGEYMPNPKENKQFFTKHLKPLQLSVADDGKVELNIKG